MLSNSFDRAYGIHHCRCSKLTMHIWEVGIETTYNAVPYCILYILRGPKDCGQISTFVNGFDVKDKK